MDKPTQILLFQSTEADPPRLPTATQVRSSKPIARLLLQILDRVLQTAEGSDGDPHR